MKSEPDKQRITVQQSWIPEKYAKIGDKLKLRENDVWDDGWEVMFVGDDVLKQEDLPDAHKAAKVHKKRTGDSLPKQRGMIYSPNTFEPRDKDHQ